MESPFHSLSRSSQIVAFGVSAAASLALMIWLGVQGQPLRTPAAPNAVIDLELAWSKARADKIVTSWGDAPRPVAVAAIAWDYLFLIAYPVCLSLSCVFISRHVGSLLAMLGVVFAWLVLCAGVLDAFENSFMLAMLWRGTAAWLTRAATICAGVKFAFVFAVFGYWIAAGLAGVIHLIKAKLLGGAA